MLSISSSVQSNRKVPLKEELACFSRLYGSDRQTLHWDPCQEVSQVPCSEIDRLYTQKLKNFERISNMLYVSSSEQPNRKVPPEEELTCFQRLYGSNRQMLHWNLCQEVFQATWSEIGRLYTQKLQNFERILNMIYVSSSEQPNREVSPEPI